MDDNNIYNRQKIDLFSFHFDMILTLSNLDHDL